MNCFDCMNKNCPHLCRRELHGFTDYMCTARKGRKVRKYDLGSGRLIKIDRLRECPLEHPDKHFPFNKTD